MRPGGGGHGDVVFVAVRRLAANGRAPGSHEGVRPEARLQLLALLPKALGPVQLEVPGRSGRAARRL